MTTTVAAPPVTTARVPAVRVRPVPRTEPPSDDELRAAGIQAPSMSAPVLPLRMPNQRRRRATGADPSGSAVAPATGPGGPIGGSAAASSPARLATRRFLAVCVEVLGGFRPMTQLRSLCLPERFDEIARRLRVHTPTGPRTGPAGGSTRPPPPRRAPTGAPPRPGRAGQGGVDRVTVRRVQVCEAIDGVTEIAAVLARRDSVWAMALRLERRQGRWFCAHLEVI